MSAIIEKARFATHMALAEAIRDHLGSVGRPKDCDPDCLADALRASGALDVLAAKAWAEGYAAGFTDADFTHLGMSTDPEASEHPGRQSVPGVAVSCDGYHFVTDLQCGLADGHVGEHVATCPPHPAPRRARVGWLEVHGGIRRLGRVVVSP